MTCIDFAARMWLQDADGDGLTFPLDTDASSGTVVVSEAGHVIYTPDADFNGADSFTYTVTDGEAVVSGTVNVTVTAIASFRGLGDLPGGRYNSEAYGVSADGTTVVGASVSDKGEEAFVWTEDGGMIGLGTLDQRQSMAYGVDSDGTAVVGWLARGSNSRNPVVWRDGHMQVIDSHSGVTPSWETDPAIVRES